MARIGTFAENLTFFESSERADHCIKTLLLENTNRKKTTAALKKRYVEENDPEVTKNRFFGYGILTTCRKSHFSTMIIENISDKVYIARNHIENGV